MTICKPLQVRPRGVRIGIIAGTDDFSFRDAIRRLRSMDIYDAFQALYGAGPSGLWAYMDLRPISNSKGIEEGQSDFWSDNEDVKALLEHAQDRAHIILTDSCYFGIPHQKLEKPTHEQTDQHGDFGST